jgi:hypothetical protein
MVVTWLIFLVLIFPGILSLFSMYYPTAVQWRHYAINRQMGGRIAQQLCGGVENV